MDSVTLRTATPADAEFMYEVYASTRISELAVTGWSDADKESFLRMQSRAQLTHYAEHYPNAEHLVIVGEGTDIGRLLVDRSGTDLRLMDIALLPPHRGHGIGSTIVKDLIAEANGLGLPIVLHVEENNPAMRLYRRLGFIKDGEAGVYHRMILTHDEVAA